MVGGRALCPRRSFLPPPASPEPRAPPSKIGWVIIYRLAHRTSAPHAYAGDTPAPQTAAADAAARLRHPIQAPTPSPYPLARPEGVFNRLGHLLSATARMGAGIAPFPPPLLGSLAVFVAGRALMS